MAKRGSITKVEDGVYRIRYYLGRQSGRRIYPQETVYGTQRQAQQRLTELLRARDTGTFIEPSRETVGAFLDRWLETHRTKLRERTFGDYADIIRRYIKPAFGPVPLARLSPVAIQQLYGDMLAGVYRTPRRKDSTGRRVGRPKPLSPRRVRYCHAVLRVALSQAVKWRQISVNPADAVTLPKQPAKEMRALSAAEMACFLEGVKELEHAALWILLASSGMRLGEALGLRWSDLEADRVLVRQSLSVTNGGLRFTEPKTAKSKRSIDLPRNALEALRKHRARQLEHAMRLGSDYDRSSDLMFAGPFGEPLHPNPLREREFQPAVKALELEPLRIHDLRHSHASLMLSAGVPVLDVSRRLGHANATLTLNTYGHAMPNADRGIADRFEAMLKATGT